MSRGVEPTERVATDPGGWVERHGDYLYRFAAAAVRHRQAAEDLVQETLLAAWRGRTGFAGGASERTWLTAILKRKVVDWLRRRGPGGRPAGAGGAGGVVTPPLSRPGEGEKPPR